MGFDPLRIYIMRTSVFSLKKLRLPLFLMLPAIIAGLVGVYYVTRVAIETPVLTDIKIDSSSTLALSAMHQTSSRNGIKEWTLDAASAKLLKGQSLAVMDDVSLTFFLENGKTVHLTSATGTLDTSTHDMTFEGSVRVVYDEYLLVTDKLHYEKKRHIMYSNDPTSITSGKSIIEADSFQSDLAGKRTTFNGNVKGTFDEKGNFINNLRGFTF